MYYFKFAMLCFYSNFFISSKFSIYWQKRGHVILLWAIYSKIYNNVHIFVDDNLYLLFISHLFLPVAHQFYLAFSTFIFLSIEHVSILEITAFII